MTGTKVLDNPAPLYSLLGGNSAIVVASNAPDEIIRAAHVLKPRLGDLIQICDGTADEVKINAALTTATGGKVVLSEGTFNIAGSIIVPSGTTLEGSGWGTKIYRITSASGATITEDLDNSETGIDVSDGSLFTAGQTIKIDTEDFFIISIAGNTLTVNTRPHNGTTAAAHSSGAAVKYEGAVVRNINTMGLVSEVSSIVVRGLWIDAGDEDADVTQTSSPGIEIRKCNNSLVEGCWVQNTQGGHPSTSDMDTYRGIGIAIDDSDDCTVRGNFATACSHGAISLRNNCNNCHIEGNHIDTTDYEGIVVCNKTFGASSATGEGCSDITIIGNHVKDFGTAGSSMGIYVEDQATTGDGNPHLRINILGNSIKRVSAGTGSGIGIVRQSGTTFTNVFNTVNGNTINGTGKGIHLSYVGNCLVSNNNVIGIITYSGIGPANCKYITITGNTSNGALDSAAGNGININTCTYCVVSGNNVIENAAPQIYLFGTSTDNQIIGNNVVGVSDKQCIYLASSGQIRNEIAENKITSAGSGNSGHAIHLVSGADYNSILNNTIGDTNASGTPTKKAIDIFSDYNIIAGNKITSVSPANSFYYAIRLETGGDYNKVLNNDVRNGYKTAGIYNTGTGNEIYANAGYIAPGEIRTVSGSLTGGAQNAILFAQQNPEAQDCFVKKVVINITTADADAANIDCGIADDASYTNGGTEFFNDLAGETIKVNDSWVVGDGGAQTKWVLWQDNASATDDWVTAKILDNDGSSIVGSYYIEYCGV